MGMRAFHVSSLALAAGSQPSPLASVSASLRCMATTSISSSPGILLHCQLLYDVGGMWRCQSRRQNDPEPNVQRWNLTSRMPEGSVGTNGFVCIEFGFDDELFGSDTILCLGAQSFSYSVRWLQYPATYCLVFLGLVRWGPGVPIELWCWCSEGYWDLSWYRHQQPAARV
jgi:hypothetical protein